MGDLDSKRTTLPGKSDGNNGEIFWNVKQECEDEKMRRDEIKSDEKIDFFQAELCLPSMTADNIMLWMVSINGLPVDARMLPVEMQEICYERGLISYVPAHKKQSADETGE